MAEMGNNGVINITSEMCNAAVTAVGEYEEKVRAIAGRMDTTVNSLVSTDFVGDAGNGYKTFYESTIKPIIAEDPKCTVLQLTQMIREMMDGLRTLLPAEDGTDDKLGEANVSAGNTQG